MKKRVISTLLCATMLVGMITGCGSFGEIAAKQYEPDTREQRDTTYISRQEQMSMDRKSRKRLRQPEFHRRSM